MLRGRQPFTFRQDFRMIHVDALDHVAIPVTDMERSLQWYGSVFGLERRFEKEWGTTPAFLCAGESCIALLANPSSALSPGPPTIRHFCFRTDRASFEAAAKSLSEMGIAFSRDDHQVSLALYFQDPDGHWIELATYEVS